MGRCSSSSSDSHGFEELSEDGIVSHIKQVIPGSDKKADGGKISNSVFAVSVIYMTTCVNLCSFQFSGLSLYFSPFPSKPGYSLTWSMFSRCFTI